jgi:hypothetical protein
VVYALMATRADGRWAAATTGREMPRQNGKGDEIEVVELWDLVQRGARVLHTIHDAVLLATETQSRMLDGLIETHPDLRRLKLKAWRGTGQQMIEMRNGGIIWYRTRSGGGGRGIDEVDRVVLDEAQHVEDEHVSAVSPTMLASANPQMNAMGTSAITGKSTWWWRLRRRALSGGDPGFAYVGHTAERVVLVGGQLERTPIDPYNRELWVASNPAVGRRPDVMGYLEEQLLRLGPDMFAREHLGVWDPEAEEVGAEVKLPADRWASAGTTEAVAPGASATMAYEVSLDGQWASVAIAAGDQQAPYVELVAHQRGAGWLTERDPDNRAKDCAIVRLAKAYNVTRLACVATGPAGQQFPHVMLALSEAGVDMKLEPLSMVAYRQACGAFYTDVVEGRLRWFHGSGPLDLAAKDAAARTYGDAWSWDIRNATVPISPLVAATVARALLPVAVETPVKPARVYSF